MATSDMTHWTLTDYNCPEPPDGDHLMKYDKTILDRDKNITFLGSVIPSNIKVFILIQERSATN